MLRALSLVALAACALCQSACAGCDGAHLSVVDAGPDDESEDAGAPPDAGEPFDSGVVVPVDSGVVVDSGPVRDAGPICDFPSPVAIPYVCEGDEDYCDLGDDRDGDPASNILAIWSHVEGTDLVVQFRFAALPFRAADDRLFVAFSEAGGSTSTANGVCQGTEPPDENICVGGAISLFVAGDESGYPPQQLGLNPNLATLDLCNSRISLATPFVELRVPAALLARTDGSFAYAARCNTDVTWPLGAPALVTSTGGSVDVVPDDLVRLCDEICAGPP
ncbi:MAG TPA: hypothetical protein VGO62_20485 [Myxococcota bacterium]|jgi:hypothetical protein